MTQIFKNKFQNNRFMHLWWPSDGVLCHPLIAICERLNEIFGDCALRLHSNKEWHPHSPNLTTCDFFFWSYLKNKILTTPPKSLQFLQERIVDECDLFKRKRISFRRAVMHIRGSIEIWSQKGKRHVEEKLNIAEF